MYGIAFASAVKIPVLSAIYSLSIYSDDITFTNQINDRLAKYNIYKDDLINTGSLQTYRLEIKYKKGVLFFDYNLYNNQKDYELEYEAENMNYAKKVVIELLNEYGIKYKESPLSKQARAIKKG